MATTTLQDVALGVRGIGGRTDFAGAAVTDLSAEEDRFINEILDEGYIKPATAFEVNEGAAATMNVVVGSNAAKADYYVVEGVNTGQGNYIVRLEGATETFALSAADPSLPRKDSVYIVVQDDAYDSSSRAVAVLAVRKGDAAASPSAPGPDAAWDAYALLATVTVPAGASDITSCTFVDERVSAEVFRATVAANAETADVADAVQNYPMPAVSIVTWERASSAAASADRPWTEWWSNTFVPPANWGTYKLSAKVDGTLYNISTSMNGEGMIGVQIDGGTIHTPNKYIDIAPYGSRPSEVPFAWSGQESGLSGSVTVSAMFRTINSVGTGPVSVQVIATPT